MFLIEQNHFRQYMSVSTLKISWRVLALCTMVLIIYSAIDIARIDHQYYIEDTDFIVCGVNYYDLFHVVLGFILVLFTLLGYALIKLNKNSEGWKRMNTEIYLTIIIFILHFLLANIQYDLYIDWL